MTGERQIIYSGQDFSLKGEKGRFVLPSGFRKTVTQSSDGKMLCLDKHPRWNCLVGFGLSHETELEAQLVAEEERAVRFGKDFDIDIRRHLLFGFARIPFDDSGRFVMPQHLIEVGSLGEQVFFHGAGTHFTLWSPDELYRMGPEFANAQAACRALAADNTKGKKG